MNDNSLNPARLIYAIEILLAQLDASLSPQMMEDDAGADRLKIKIDGFMEKAARLRTVLSKAQAALVEAYAKAQGMFRGSDSPDPVFADTIALDLSTVESSLAGPRSEIGLPAQAREAVKLARR